MAPAPEAAAQQAAPAPSGAALPPLAADGVVVDEGLIALRVEVCRQNTLTPVGEEDDIETCKRLCAPPGSWPDARCLAHCKSCVGSVCCAVGQSPEGQRHCSAAPHSPRPLHRPRSLQATGASTADPSPGNAPPIAQLTTRQMPPCSLHALTSVSRVSLPQPLCCAWGGTTRGTCSIDATASPCCSCSSDKQAPAWKETVTSITRPPTSTLTSGRPPSRGRSTLPDVSLGA